MCKIQQNRVDLYISVIRYVKKLINSSLIPNAFYFYRFVYLKILFVNALYSYYIKCIRYLSLVAEIMFPETEMQSISRVSQAFLY